jgi:hypothetical protein
MNLITYSKPINNIPLYFTPNYEQSPTEIVPDIFSYVPSGQPPSTFLFDSQFISAVGYIEEIAQ